MRHIVQTGFQEFAERHKLGKRLFQLEIYEFQFLLSLIPYQFESCQGHFVKTKWNQCQLLCPVMFCKALEYSGKFSRNSCLIMQKLLGLVVFLIASLRNRTAGRLRTAKWRKNVARDCAFPILRDIFSSFCRPESSSRPVA